MRCCSFQTIGRVDSAESDGIVIEPQYAAHGSRLRPSTESERLECDVAHGRCRIGADAAREIARRIEGEHGFWDFEERKAVNCRIITLPLPDSAENQVVGRVDNLRTAS